MVTRNIVQNIDIEKVGAFVCGLWATMPPEDQRMIPRSNDLRKRKRLVLAPHAEVHRTVDLKSSKYHQLVHSKLYVCSPFTDG